MDKILSDLTKEILRGTKNVELIFVYGSYAFGTMQEHSDIDVYVLTGTKPRRERLFRFVPLKRRMVLLTVHFVKLSDAVREFRDKEKWVWVYMAYMNAKVLFDRDRNMDKIKKELLNNEVTSESLFTFVPESASYLIEYIGKLRNAFAAKDELNVLAAAEAITEMCYNMLRPFNLVWKYTSENETYTSFLELPRRPRHYVEDFKICRRLTMNQRSMRTVYDSAMRLARETVEFLRENGIEDKVRDRDFLQFFKSNEYKDALQ